MSSDKKKPVESYAEVDAVATARRGRTTTVTEEGHEAVPVTPPAPPAPRPNVMHAEVEVGIGATIGLPGYSAARFDVKVRLPCKADLASVEATYNAAVVFCRGKLDELKAGLDA